MIAVTFHVEIDVFGVSVFCEGKSLNCSTRTSFWRFKTGGGDVYTAGMTRGGQVERANIIITLCRIRVYTLCDTVAYSPPSYANADCSGA